MKSNQLPSPTHSAANLRSRRISCPARRQRRSLTRRAFSPRRRKQAVTCLPAALPPALRPLARGTQTRARLGREPAVLVEGGRLAARLRGRRLQARSKTYNCTAFALLVNHRNYNDNTMLTGRRFCGSSSCMMERFVSFPAIMHLFRNLGHRLLRLLCSSLGTSIGELLVPFGLVHMRARLRYARSLEGTL